MRISIACALFNGENYILEQLQSLRNQSEANFEVILFDDCSTDNTYNYVYDFINTYALHNWKLYKQSTNKGYIENFYDALKACSGDIIFLCDQDDIWEPNKIQICMRFFNEHPEIECVNTAYKILDMASNTITISNHHKLDLSFEGLLKHNIAMGCTMAIRKTLITLYLKNTVKKAPHDWEINALAASRNTLFFINEPLLTYRIHNMNTTGIDTLKTEKKQIRAKSREMNAAVMLKLAQGLKGYSLSTSQTSFLNSYQDFTLSRYQLLHDKKIFEWLHLFKYPKIYLSIISVKGIATDLLYALFTH